MKQEDIPEDEVVYFDTLAVNHPYIFGKKIPLGVQLPKNCDRRSWYEEMDRIGNIAQKSAERLKDTLRHRSSTPCS